MANFLMNGPGLLLLGLFFAFYWVPFALGAYLLEIWHPKPIRHTTPERPAAPTPA